MTQVTLPAAQEDESSSGSSLEEPTSSARILEVYKPAKLRETVKNPLFALEERPDVIGTMFRDIIYSYQQKRNLDIHAYKNNEDYLANYRALTPEECVSLEVRISHDLMNLWTHHIKPEEPKPKKKKQKKKVYKQASAHHSVISAGEISLGHKRLQESEA